MQALLHRNAAGQEIVGPVTIWGTWFGLILLSLRRLWQLQGAAQLCTASAFSSTLP